MKNNDFTLHSADISELSECVSVLSQGRAYQQSQGFIQWPDGYPSPEDVAQDIAAGCAYVLKNKGKICAYFYMAFTDPTYSRIQGAWRADSDYMVMHRVAIADGYRGTGLSSVLFGAFEDIARKNSIVNLRIDTHPENIPMQRVLGKNGYTYCGTVMQNNGLRLAFDKLLGE